MTLPEMLQRLLYLCRTMPDHPEIDHLKLWICAEVQWMGQSEWSRKHQVLSRFRELQRS